MTDISIVIPIFNEEDNIKILFNEISKNIPKNIKYEIIYIDDGSTDDSLKIIKNLSKGKSYISFYKLNKNYGQSTALHCGISKSKGKYVITIDGDMQNDPSDIMKFYKEIKNTKYDCIFGWRKKRKENSFLRIFLSKIANAIIKKILNNHINDLGCTFKCFKREIFDKIIWSTDFHRYFSAFIINEGFLTKEIEVKHNKRYSGISKYGYSRIFSVFIDIIFLSFVFNSLKKPLHFFGKFSLLFLLLSFILSTVAIFLKFFEIKKFTETPLPELIIFLALTSIIILFFGILAELILSLYFHLKGKRDYIVK